MSTLIPWYLRDKFIWAVCIILPPLAYIILLLNKKKLNHKKYVENLTIATIIVGIWVLKFLPGKLYPAFIFTVLIGYYLRKYFYKKKK
ncbi:hypothetical protein ACFVRR_07335 [Gottfriedia sp. NPDC057948]|uniref:hypothetical protein n=1 Tax=Gottfriedia sp. NPDC057948 TaxID=3346287 RepID=UPI0036DABB47